MKSNRLVTLFPFIFILLIIAGSTGLAEERLRFSCSTQIAEAFGKEVVHEFQKATGIITIPHISDSKTAMNRLMNGFSDMTATTIRLTYAQKENGYVEIPFCKDPLVLFTHKNNPVKNISKAQLIQVFNGKIDTWDRLGGPQEPIVIITPLMDTDAFQNFHRLVMPIHEVKFDMLARNSIMVINAVVHLPGSISFIAQGAISKNPDVVPLTIDGISCTQPEYPYYQIFSFVTRGKPTGITKEAINFALSEKGQAIMKKNGMYPIIQ